MDVGSSSGMRLEQWGSILWAFEQNDYGEMGAHICGMLPHRIIMKY